MIEFEKMFPKKWKELRKNVIKRDGRRCQFRENGKQCTYKKLLQVHHILKKADFPSLVWDENNCITLCIKHHKQISGRENEFVHIFKKIVGKNNEGK